MQTQVEQVAENRVRLTVEVPSHDVQHAVQHAASDLAGSLKIPGFRQGKVPMPVLLARVGRERLFAEAIESHIGSWFWNAAARSRIHPIERPEFDYEVPGSEAESWTFTATVAVQPKPEVADWTALEVPRADAEVPEDLIEHELNALRGTVAQLVPVEERPAQLGDTLVIDLVNPDGDAQRDYVVELGAGRLVEEIEQGLVGASAGETRGVDFELADDSTGRVEITVKEIKEKELPALDDDLARAATEFDTLEELRAELEARLREQIEAEVDSAFRAAAIDRLVEASDVSAAGPLVESRTAELFEGLSRSLERRGISIEAYLQLTGAAPEQVLERLRAEASQSVARELVLEAVADKLQIDVPDSEVDALIREQAEAAGDDPEATIEEVKHGSGYERLRDDLRLRAALDRIVDQVKPIAPELADARDKLWTPEKEKTSADTKLWTPGSKEPA